jgi:hypothetical protein
MERGNTGSSRRGCFMTVSEALSTAMLLGYPRGKVGSRRMKEESPSYVCIAYSIILTQ